MDVALCQRLSQWVGEVVVVDCRAPFLAVGKLSTASDDFLELSDADMHDLRDTSTSRENYLVKISKIGVQANRRNLLIRMDEVVGLSRLDDVIW